MLETHQRSASASSPLLNPPVPPFAKARRPSLTNAMSWLHKSSNSISHTPGPYSPKSLQISEPKLTSSTGSLEKVSVPRLGPLGSGATIVSTPQEALKAVGARSPSAADIATITKKTLAQAPRSVERLIEEEEEPPLSPPLPPLPVPWQSSARSSAGSSSGAGGSRSLPPSHPPPQSPLPMTPEATSQRSSLKNRHSSQSARSRSVGASSVQATRISQGQPPMPIPSLPLELLSAPEQADFEPVLVSDLAVNLHRLDSSRVIVTLETATSSYKSTLKTLSSRPSKLATYLLDLVASTTTAHTPSPDTPTDETGEDGDSVYSQRSEFHDSDVDEESGFDHLFRDHFGGKTPKKSKPKRRADQNATIHLFLDRPSNPYAHILSYLRTPSTPESPVLLPYSLRLFSNRTSFSSSRIEQLLELRDEAAFLDLSDLEKACNDDLVSAAVPHHSHSVPVEERGSVHSTHTLCEPDDRLAIGNEHKEVDPLPMSPSSTAVEVPILHASSEIAKELVEVETKRQVEQFRFPAPAQTGLQFRQSSRSPTRSSRGRDREAVPPRMMSSSEYI